MVVVVGEVGDNGDHDIMNKATLQFSVLFCIWVQT